MYDELLSPPRRSVEPPYGARYDCKTLNSVATVRHLPKRKTDMRLFVDLMELPSGLNLCSRTQCPINTYESGLRHFQIVLLSC